MQIPYLRVRGRKLPHFIGCSRGPRIEICEISCLPIPMVPLLYQSNDYIKSKLPVLIVQKCLAVVGAGTVLTIQGCKLPHFMEGSKGPRMEICSISGLPIPLVPRLHQCNRYIKRKLRAWRVQKCVALVCADTVITSAGPLTTPFKGGEYSAQNGNMRNFGPTNPHGIAFAPNKWLIKRKLQEWRVQKCISLVGADMVLTSAEPPTTPFHGVQYRAQNGNLRNFGRTNPYRTAFAPKQWLYQKEATGMNSSKMHCPSRFRYRTYQCGDANYPVSSGAV